MATDQRKILRLRPNHQAPHTEHCGRWRKLHRGGTLAILGFLLLLGAQAVAEEIALVKEGEVYVLPVRINDMITLDFLLDTGASEVQIPADVALTLLRQKTIKDEDFLPGATYALADGSTVRSPRFTVRSLQLGSHRVISVPASVGTLTSGPILGMSFLNRLEAFSIDTTRRMLIIHPRLIAAQRPLDEGAAPRPSVSAPQPRSPWPPSGAPSPASASLGLQAAMAAAEQDVRQMITLASTAGGMGREADILAAKSRIEALNLKERVERKQRVPARQENAKGLTYLQDGQTAEAVTAFQTASSMDASDVEITNNLGYAYFLHGDLPSAERWLLRTLALAPGRTNGWANLGLTYAHRQDVRIAVACFANAYRFSRHQETTRQFLQKWGEDSNSYVSEAARQALQLQLVSR
jgi:clan AA aspartic protease (TIGR02281 family)